MKFANIPRVLVVTCILYITTTYALTEKNTEDASKPNLLSIEKGGHKSYHFHDGSWSVLVEDASPHERNHEEDLKIAQRGDRRSLARNTGEVPTQVSLFENPHAVMKRNSVKTEAFLLIISGTLSFFASSIVIVVVLRSHSGLSNPFHRLLIGLSIADIISSLGHAAGPFMSPSDVAYEVWNAIGNITSCTIQGVLLMFGMGAGIIYNCVLCFYYLAVIKYEKTDQYVRKNLEPFFHAVAILSPLGICVYYLLNEGFNNSGGTCYIAKYDPPHCEAYNDGEVPPGFTVPCGRGNRNNINLFWIGSMCILFCTPIIFIVTMTMMYKAVLKVEKKTLMYGVGSLRMNLRGKQMIKDKCSTAETSKNSVDNYVKKDASCTTSLTFCERVKKSCSSRREGNSGSRSRLIFYRAAAYLGAWIFCYLLHFIMIPFHVAGIETHSKIWNGVHFASAFFHPLQGLLNLLIFLQPNILSIRSSDKNITWFRAFAKALKARGTSTGVRRGSSKNLGRVRRSFHHYFRSTITGQPKSSRSPSEEEKVEFVNEHASSSVQNLQSTSVPYGNIALSYSTFASNMDSTPVSCVTFADCEVKRSKFCDKVTDSVRYEHGKDHGKKQVQLIRISREEAKIVTEQDNKSRGQENSVVGGKRNVKNELLPIVKAEKSFDEPFPTYREEGIQGDFAIQLDEAERGKATFTNQEL